MTRQVVLATSCKLRPYCASSTVPSHVQRLSSRATSPGTSHEHEAQVNKAVASSVATPP